MKVMAETKTDCSDLYGLLVQADRIAEDALQALEYTSKNSLAHARYLQLDRLRTQYITAKLMILGEVLIYLNRFSIVTHKS